MSRIMTIWLPRWPVQRRLIERPELRRRPVFVCRRERRGVMTVVAWAWAAPPRKTVPSVPAAGANPGRIPAGMSLAEAMAVLALSHGSRACHIAEVPAIVGGLRRSSRSRNQRTMSPQGLSVCMSM